MAKQQKKSADTERDVHEIEGKIDKALEDVGDEEVDERLDEAIEEAGDADPEEVLHHLEEGHGEAGEDPGKTSGRGAGKATKSGSNRK